jgi:hypothetical protein
VTFRDLLTVHSCGCEDLPGKRVNHADDHERTP